MIAYYHDFVVIEIDLKHSFWMKIIYIYLVCCFFPWQLSDVTMCRIFFLI